jgi:hypothetical protein
MTRAEAKQVLALYRPGSPEAPDAELAGALELVNKDAELRNWFKDHCASQGAIRAAFRSIRPPEALREQILSEKPADVPTLAWRKPAKLALVTVLSVALVVMVAQLLDRTGHTEDLSFASYRGRMVGTALRLYGMDLETNNTAVIRAYLGQRQARADFSLPKGLAGTTATGCGVLSWQGNPVSMICFRSGRPLKEGEKTDLFLFVMNRTAAPDAPRATTPQIAPENRMITASWTDGDLIYILAAEGDERFLRKYL